ncbi:hypothetical protein [Nocardiopsis synnemataformans]|uniref:hypothetical protein n=1 Tax=Nocardiopsis synnemataformans TaxID=61305 RepID=UPI003EBA43CF
MRSFYLGWFYLVLGLAWAGAGVARFWLKGPMGVLWFYPVPALGFSAIGVVFFRQHRRERSQSTSSGERAQDSDP